MKAVQTFQSFRIDPTPLPPPVVCLHSVVKACTSRAKMEGKLVDKCVTADQSRRRYRNVWIVRHISPHLDESSLYLRTYQ